MYTGKDKKIFDKIVKQLNENAKKKNLKKSLTQLKEDIRVKETV
jgi:hypothetical protein